MTREPQEWTEPVSVYIKAAGGRAAQDRGSLLALRTPRSHRSSRPETLVALDVSGDLVAVAI